MWMGSVFTSKGAMTMFMEPLKLRLPTLASIQGEENRIVGMTMMAYQWGLLYIYIYIYIANFGTWTGKVSDGIMVVYDYTYVLSLFKDSSTLSVLWVVLTTILSTDYNVFANVNGIYMFSQCNVIALNYVFFCLYLICMDIEKKKRNLIY